MNWKLKTQPITSRFEKYSEEDREADELWQRYKDLEPWESHGGANLHELPPSVQRLIYDFARALKLGGLGLKIEHGGKNLPYARRQ